MALFFGLLFFRPVVAQSVSEVRGTVAGAQSGPPLREVEIRLTGTSYRTTSDARGAFRIIGITPGNYILEASASGYWPLTEHFRLDSNETKAFEVILSPNTQRRIDTISLQSGSVFDAVGQDAPSQFALTGNDLKQMSSVLADDPLRAIQAAPGVSSDDDFEARFSLRGADFSRVGVYLDGILLHQPFHTIETSAASGSITAFNGDLIQRLELYTGAYPVQFGDRSAGALDIHTRDGSRDRYSFRVSASFAKTGVMAEGPLGAWKRCSWIAAFRKSYLQYLLARTNNPSLAFGIEDAQLRLSCNVTSRSSLSLNVIDSYTDLDRSAVSQKLGVNSLLLAGYHFNFAALAWQYTPNDKFLMANRAAWMREKFDDRNPSHKPLGMGHYNELVWDSSMSWLWNAHSPLNAGLNIRTLRDTGSAQQYNPPAGMLTAYNGSGMLAGAFLHQSWVAWNERLHISAGGRWDRHSIDGVTAFSPQVSLTLSPASSMRLQLGWGQYVQYPEIFHLRSNLGGGQLLPLRSTQLVGAVEQRIGGRMRVRAELYARQDRDILFRPLFDPRLINGKAFIPRLTSSYENSLRGNSRGVEIYLQRIDPNRLTGWVSYAYGRTSLRDGVTNLSFPSDWDQRHTINIYGTYCLRPSIAVSLRSSYGSGFPVPGFLEKIGSQYFLSSQRNRLRLASYYRTDIRVNKYWTHANWKTTLYGEVINLANRTNQRFDSFNGYNARTTQAFVTLDKLLPILPSVGIVLER